MFTNMRHTLFLILALVVSISSAKNSFRFASQNATTAQTFTVTKTADTNDGACDSDCSLREAIVAANLNPGSDIIVIPSGTYTLTIVGIDENASATGDLDIAGDLRFNGTGAEGTIIDGGGIDRIMEILPANPPYTVVISGLTIQNGARISAGEQAAGIRSMGFLTVTESVVANNAGAGIESR